MSQAQEVEQLAEDLLRARDEARVASPPSRHDPKFDLDAGYRVGFALHERLLGRGLQAVGRKTGFTNPAT